MAATTHFVTPAPGHYGDTARIISSHRTLAAARRSIRGYHGYVVREGAKAKGDSWRRVDETIYPVAR